MDFCDEKVKQNAPNEFVRGEVFMELFLFKNRFVVGAKPRADYHNAAKIARKIPVFIEFLFCLQEVFILYLLRP